MRISDLKQTLKSITINPGRETALIRGHEPMDD